MTHSLTNAFTLTCFASHRVVMDGFNGTVGAYTLGTTCPPNVTYMGVATCGQTLTGDTTGAVSGSPLLPCVTSQQLMTHCLPHTRTPAHSAHSQRRLCVAVVTKPLPASVRETVAQCWFVERVIRSPHRCICALLRALTSIGTQTQSVAD
jgi:hypothetical protein